MTKRAQYAALVENRKACRRCPGLENPADVEGGTLDADQIGPWSRWQGNLDAAVMVVGQDWGDVAYFKTNRGRDLARNPTNRTLVELLAVAGIEVDPLRTPRPRQTAFFTNAILCLKSHGLQAKVNPDWFLSCRDFPRRQIEIVRPSVVIGLGECAYRSILAGFGLQASRFRDEVCAWNGRSLAEGTRVFAVYHCGARICNTHRPLDQQKRDWLRMRPHLQGGRPG
jgi:DNA polymerase